MTIIRVQFGPVLTERETKALNYADALGRHDGCWINDWDCGAPDCPMRRFGELPETIEIDGVEVKR